jgi:hypothetical protein
VPRIGALLFSAGGQPRYVRAALAVRVAPTPPLTRVPGAPPELLGVVLHEGIVVPVLSVGAARRDMIVCVWEGELVAFVGAEEFETGVFEPSAGAAHVVEHRGRRYVELDVVGLCSAVAQGARGELGAG